MENGPLNLSNVLFILFEWKLVLVLTVKKKMPVLFQEQSEEKGSIEQHSRLEMVGWQKQQSPKQKSEYTRNEEDKAKWETNNVAERTEKKENKNI